MAAPYDIEYNWNEWQTNEFIRIIGVHHAEIDMLAGESFDAPTWRSIVRTMNTSNMLHYGTTPFNKFSCKIKFKGLKMVYKAVNKFLDNNPSFWVDTEFNRIRGPASLTRAIRAVSNLFIKFVNIPVVLVIIVNGSNIM